MYIYVGVALDKLGKYHKAIIMYEATFIILLIAKHIIIMVKLSIN